MSKKMKLSDAMEKGFERVGKKQLRRMLFNDNIADGACALGCVYLGMDSKNNTTRNPRVPSHLYYPNIYRAIREKFSDLRKKAIDCLPAIELASLNSQIMDSNDHEKMSIPAIIKGLRKSKL